MSIWRLERYSNYDELQGLRVDAFFKMYDRNITLKTFVWVVTLFDLNQKNEKWQLSPHRSSIPFQLNINFRVFPINLRINQNSWDHLLRYHNSVATHRHICHVPEMWSVLSIGVDRNEMSPSIGMFSKFGSTVHKEMLEHTSERKEILDSRTRTVN